MNDGLDWKEAARNELYELNVRILKIKSCLAALESSIEERRAARGRGESTKEQERKDMRLSFYLREEMDAMERYRSAFEARLAFEGAVP